MQINTMTLEEARQIVAWCNFQDEGLWDDLTLTGIVALYNASHEYDTFEAWLECEEFAAKNAYETVRSLS